MKPSYWARLLFSLIGDEDDFALENIENSLRVFDESSELIDENCQKKISAIFAKLFQNTFDITEFVLVNPPLKNSQFEKHKVSSICLSAKPVLCECQDDCLKHIFGDLKFELHLNEFSSGQLCGLNTRVFTMTPTLPESPISPINPRIECVRHPAAHTSAKSTENVSTELQTVEKVIDVNTYSVESADE